MPELSFLYLPLLFSLLAVSARIIGEHFTYDARVRRGAAKAARELLIEIRLREEQPHG